MCKFVPILFFANVYLAKRSGKIQKLMLPIPFHHPRHTSIAPQLWVRVAGQEGDACILKEGMDKGPTMRPMCNNMVPRIDLPI